MVQEAQTAATNGGDRDRIVEEFLPYIRYSARRLRWRLTPSLAEEDLVSAGVAGLLDALSRFHDGRVKLRTYAEYRIRGAMLDALRAADVVPRSARDRIKAAKLAHANLERKLGRMPDDAEVAKEMGITLAVYHRILGEMGWAIVVRFEDMESRRGDGGELAAMESLHGLPSPDPLSLFEGERRKEQLAKVVEELPEKERLVVSMYYRDEMTMKEIGAVLGLTEGRVCQLHSQAILRMRARLDPESL